jgi:phosphoglycolate phosphatase
VTEAVLFDFDGVLVDSRAAVAGCLNATFAAHGMAEREPAELHQFIGPPLHETFALLVGPGDAPACVATFREIYRARAAAETPVFDGIPELLGALAGRPLAVATSKPQPVAEPMLTALGLREHFATVAGPPLEHDQPKARTIADALEALGVADATMVGDRSFDVVGAHAHGLRANGVLWGIGDEAELRAAGADALAASPTELLALLS